MAPSAHDQDAGSDPDVFASEKRFRLLVQSVHDYAIFMLDPQGHIASWNDGARRAKGYTEEEILGKHFSIFYTEPDRQRDFPAYELEVASREGRFEDEGWRVRKDGTTFWANVVITAMRGEDGSLEGFAKVTRDLTERKRAEEDMAQVRGELERHRLAAEQAREINDTIVQGLVVAQYSMELGNEQKTAAAIRGTLKEAQRIVMSLLADAGIEPGDLRRGGPAEPLGDADAGGS